LTVGKTRGIKGGEEKKGVSQTGGPKSVSCPKLKEEQVGGGGGEQPEKVLRLAREGGRQGTDRCPWDRRGRIRDVSGNLGSRKKKKKPVVQKLQKRAIRKKAKERSKVKVKAKRQGPNKVCKKKG